MAPRKTTRHRNANPKKSNISLKQKNNIQIKKKNIKGRSGTRKLKKKTVEIAVNKRQSPIDIRKEFVRHDPKLCQRDSLLISYSSGDCCDVTTSTAGFRVNVGLSCTTSLRGKHLPGDFQLAQFHAHWSGDGSRGSEHLLNGKAMSGEVHFVFWNKKYGTVEAATEKEDGLAVLAVFLKQGLHSSAYQPLLYVIHRADAEKRSVPMPENFSLEQLLPDKEHRDFVTYLGSLTTPPFSENVIWTVLLKPVEVSKGQLDILRAIVSSNYRECQDLCHRKILASTVISTK